MKTKTLLIKLFVSLALLALLSLKIKAHDLETAFHDIRFLPCFYAGMLMLAQVVFLAARWRIVVSAGEKESMPYPAAWRITAASFLANYLFITSIGGVIARVFLTMSEGFSLAKCLAAIVVDRLLTLAALGTLALVFLPFGNFFPPAMMNVDLPLAVLGLAVCSAAALFFARKKLLTHHRIAMGIKYLRELATNPMILLQLGVFSLTAQMLYFAAVYVVLISLNPGFSATEFLAVIPVIALVASLPIGYGGWGMREGAFIYGLGLIHVPAAAAFAASIQIGIISMLAAALAGIPALLDDSTRQSLKNWKHLKAKSAHDPV